MIAIGLLFRTLGYLFHCNRDFAMAEGFSFTLTARRLLWKTPVHCDFRFARKASFA